MTDTARAHIVLPRALLEEIDALVGKRKRSEFIAEAVEDRVAHTRLLALAERVRGSIPEGEVPEWDTLESTLAWQRAQRPIDDPWKEALGAEGEREAEA